MKTRQIKRWFRGLAAVFIVFLFSSLNTFAQRVERTIKDWRPLHYSVIVSLPDQLQSINATVDVELEILATGVRNVDLQFGDMTIESVKVDGDVVQFAKRPGIVSVPFPTLKNAGSRLHLTIAYNGIPKDGLILTRDKDGKPSATGDNWPDRVHNWIPCIDHPSAKAPVTFTITAPQREVVVANGGLVSQKNNADHTVTWIYDEKVAIPAYCMVIAVGEFSVFKPQSKYTLSSYVARSDAQLATEFAPAAEMIDFYSERFAPYPYEKLALIVAETRFGGMENSSAIVFPPNFLRRRGAEPLTAKFQVPFNVEVTSAHEIAHQWFGDSVTESTWADLWLSEGFATYCAGLFLERYEGEAVFRDYMRNQAASYFAYEHQEIAPIHDTESGNLMSLLNPNNYQKGAWVLHMLRGMLGDETFFKGIRIYYKAHMNGNADTEDLRKALEVASGKDLKVFFDRWVYKSGHPVFEAMWSWKPAGKGGVVSLEIKQTQQTPEFLMPLPISFKTSNGGVTKIIQLSGRSTPIQIPLDEMPSEVNIDPEGMVLKEVGVVRPKE